jgi:hypothetical protein
MNCPACGCYVPRALNGRQIDCGCGRTPPSDGLPFQIFACPKCGGHGKHAWGCWGTAGRPHPHAFMRPIHKLIAMCDQATLDKWAKLD